MSWSARLAKPRWRSGPRPRPPIAVLGAAILALMAWIALALDLVPMAMASSGATTASSGPPWICSLPGGMRMSGVGGPGGPVATALAAMPMWSLMAVATMVPAALPATSHVAVNSLRRRRGRAVCEFVMAYLALWFGFGAVALLLLALLPLDRAAPLFAVGLGLAALWELSPAKRWALNRCHRTSPLPPSGWRAGFGTARFGVLHGGACVASCWPLMLVMTVAPTARLAWCAGLGILSLSEKIARRPRRSAHRVSLLLALGSLGVAAAISLGGG
jgi:predicted metal-binding membrane protein